MSRIAVLIPVYNQPDDLIRTLASIDRQRADLQFFVVDDGSDPPLTLDPSGYKHALHLIRLEQNRGCTVARNTALTEIFRGDYDYVALQDAGDIDVGERMAREAEFLDANPDIAVVGAWAQYVDRAGNPLYVYKAPATTREIRARMPYVSAFAHPATMIRTSALKNIGGYDPTYRIASDYEIFFRLTKACETANLQEILIHKEEHPSSLSVGRRRYSLIYRLRAQMKHFSASSARSYLGVLWTLTLLLLPYGLIVAIKRWRGFAQ